MHGLITHKRIANMEDLIKLSQLNDFIFCPISIYFHNLMGNQENYMYQTTKQINGTAAHRAVDNNQYSTRSTVLTGIDVYCEKYGLIGKIDIFDIEEGILTERKKSIKNIYDGYVFQLYGQYFALKEMGYNVSTIRFHSMDDNKLYYIDLPEKDLNMLEKFEKTIEEMKDFDIRTFVQINREKCLNCIYEPACDRGLI